MVYFKSIYTFLIKVYETYMLNVSCKSTVM